MKSYTHFSGIRENRVIHMSNYNITRAISAVPKYDVLNHPSQSISLVTNLMHGVSRASSDLFKLAQKDKKPLKELNGGIPRTGEATLGVIGGLATGIKELPKHPVSGVAHIGDAIFSIPDIPISAVADFADNVTGAHQASYSRQYDHVLQTAA